LAAVHEQAIAYRVGTHDLVVPVWLQDAKDISSDPAQAESKS
jgi:hypothetical protein